MDWMRDLPWTLVLAPVLGLVGALVGGLASPLVTARRTRQLWLLQQRADLYTEFLRFTIYVEGRVESITGDRQLDVPELRASLEASERLRPRLKILASSPVVKAYEDLGRAYDGLSAAAGPRTSPRREVAADDPLVTAVAAAVDSAYRVCRKALVPRRFLGLGRG